ncbi:MAG: anthranilate synthase component I family protein [Nitrospirae bacterium]|nr:anthranilate synthase component I family protein [Nitrospirota bacterium]
MLILPSKSKFIEDAKEGRLSPVYAELPFIPPHRVYEALETPYSFLFESAKGPENIARYSFVGIEPFLIFRVKNGAVEIEVRNQKSEDRSQKTEKTKTPLKKLKGLIKSYKIESHPNLPPFIGGAVGLFSYDFVHYFEHLPKTAVDDLEIPDAHFLFIDTIVAFDHKEKKTYIISCPGADEAVSKSIQGAKGSSDSKWGEDYERSCEKIKILYNKIKTILPSLHPNKKTCSLVINPIEIHHAMSKLDYMDIVKKAKEYIKAGDIFQANLSQRVSVNVGDTPPWRIYSLLRRINPSPFGGYLNMNDYHIVSSSPERLIRVLENIVETRPIAGTRPRGANDMADIEMRTELLLNEKERAEHLMLIDLERNDLGRISDYGSVVVDEFMITEDYSHVIHIVSNIKGALAKGMDCFDAIRAAFPGGTITGVPKVRCMEIIDELEPLTRGPYTGSMGYISFTSNMDLNIIIRTFVVKNNTAYVQAGAGIVADSDPEREYNETLKKAEALIKTLERL